MQFQTLLTIMGSSLLVDLPILLALLVGIIVAVIALVRGWQRGSAVLAMIAFILAGLQVTFSPLISNMPYLLSSQYNLPVAKITPIIIGLSVVSSVITAVVWVLVILAIFTGRKTPAPANNPLNS